MMEIKLNIKNAKVEIKVDNSSILLLISNQEEQIISEPKVFA